MYTIGRYIYLTQFARVTCSRYISSVRGNIVIFFLMHNFVVFMNIRDTEILVEDQV